MVNCELFLYHLSCVFVVWVFSLNSLKQTSFYSLLNIFVYTFVITCLSLADSYASGYDVEWVGYGGSVPVFASTYISGTLTSVCGIILLGARGVALLLWLDCTGTTAKPSA